MAWLAAAAVAKSLKIIDFARAGAQFGCQNHRSVPYPTVSGVPIFMETGRHGDLGPGGNVEGFDAQGGTRPTKGTRGCITAAASEGPKAGAQDCTIPSCTSANVSACCSSGSKPTYWWQRTRIAPYSLN